MIRQYTKSALNPEKFCSEVEAALAIKIYGGPPNGDFLYIQPDLTIELPFELTEEQIVVLDAVVAAHTP